MPSKKRPARKRQKIAVPPQVWLWGLALLSIWVGLEFSPITHAYRIRVSGASPEDHARIQKILQGYSKAPSRRLNVRSVESKVLENERINSATYSQNLFGRGLLKIVQAQPVANLTSDPPRQLTDIGRVISVPTTRQDLPKVKLPETTRSASLTLLSKWEAQRIAEFCKNLKKTFPITSWTIELDDRGMISLGLEPRGSVLLGNSEKLSEKLATLKELMEADTEVLNRSESVNLTVPDRPMIVPRGSGI